MNKPEVDNLQLRKKSGFLLTIALAITTFFALPIQAEVITLDQAKALANENSRSLARYQLNIKKAAYQINQAQWENTVQNNLFDSLMHQYQSVKDQIAALQGAEDDDDNSQLISQLQQQLTELSKEMDSQLKGSSTAYKTLQNSEENYEDIKINADNYEKQLDYEVEKLYIAILNEQNNLETALLQKQAAELELEMVKTRYNLGSATQNDVYEKSKGLTDLNSSMTSSRQKINSSQGALNDIMGKDYAAELELVPFAPAPSLNIPEYADLLGKVNISSQTLKKAQQAVADTQDQLQDTDDIYERLILTLEIKQKELDLDEQKLQLSQSVQNLLYETVSRQEAYEAAKLGCQKAQQKFAWDQKRFELGQLSEQSLLNSEISYANAKSKQDAAGYALFLAAHSLELAKKGMIGS